MRILLSDKTHRDIYVKISANRVSNNTRAKHTVLGNLLYALADDRKLRLIADPDSGFMVHVATQRQEYVNLEHGTWYSFAVASGDSVKVRGVHMYCEYRATGKATLRVLYNMTNHSGTLPLSVAPVGIPDGYKAPTAATDLTRRAKPYKLTAVRRTAKPKHKGPKQRRTRVQRPEPPDIVRPVRVVPDTVRPVRGMPTTVRPVPVRRMPNIVQPRPLRARQMRRRRHSASIEELISAVAEDMRRSLKRSEQE